VPQKVKALLDFAMEQIKWDYPHAVVTQTIIDQMKASSFVPTIRTKHIDGRGYAADNGQCAKYVKIALWKAGFVPFEGDFSHGISPASKLGPFLEQAGFTNIISLLPDGRWAAPGDVLVYQKKGDPGAAGHIDIRSYDGYISDFWETYLPTTNFQVVGIYRKFFDPLPEKRIRAFLKVIRSREAETLFLGSGDAASYTALPIKKGHTGPPPQFTSFSEHPFAGTSERLGASGAYGITRPTWELYIDKWVPTQKGEERFSPRVQDRISVAVMEMNPGQGWGGAPYQTMKPTSLTLIRQGKIEDAATQLATTRQWTSLPGGAESKDTMPRFMSDFNKYLAEQK
jgi:muramidase (phage lysozyme)